MNLLNWIKMRLLPADPESVAAYQTVLPRNIHVSIKKDGGTLIAIVDEVGDEKVKGLLITEAKDLNGLVSAVNDLIYTKVNMPLNIRPYYGNIFKPPDGYKKDAKSMVLTKA